MSDSGHSADPIENADRGERLQRVLAQRGVASRRACEQLITEGRVSVNGSVVTELGVRVHPTKDRIAVDGKQIPQQKPRYLLLNKPPGFITTVSDERSRWTVMDLISVPERVYPVGRLDRESQGLLLMTNDGEVANRVMHPRYRLSKEYHVLTPRKPGDGQMQELRDGVLVQDKLVVPDEVRLLRETPEGIIIRLVIHEGMFHVVRQMMDKVHIEVAKLTRHRVGPISVTGIPIGAWRDLTPGEIDQLFEAIGLSQADADTANSRRSMQLDPVGGYNPAPKIRHPKRYAEVARHRERLEQGAAPKRQRTAADSREGTGFGRSRTGAPSATGTARGGKSGKARSPQSHRNRRPGGGR